MTNSRFGGPRGIAAALVLTIAALLVAALCVKAMIGNIVAEGDRSLAGYAPAAPEVILPAAVDALVRQYGHVDAATRAAVRGAAIAAPLDARPYLILGHQQLLDRQPARALATFEAGQRLDPRQPLLHVLLLDRYLRTGRYPDAASQMSVLTRISGATEPAVAMAMAAMALAPQTRVSVERTLHTDPALERAVLTTMARAGVAPAQIFALASPAARRDAGAPDGWGTALVARLVAARRYREARQIWQRVSGIDAAAATPTIFDAAFRPSPAAPPFNWTLTAGSIGAADLRGGGLAIDYYGRDDGELASQLVVLHPGRWRFGFTVDPGKTDASSRLFWTLTCAGGDKPLASVPIVAAASPRRVSADIAVPAGCPAAHLALRGEGGDIPAPVSVTVRAPSLVAVEPEAGA